MPTTIWSEDFEDLDNTTTADRAYSSNGLVDYLPSGWEKFSNSGTGDYGTDGTNLRAGYVWRGTGYSSWKAGPGNQSQNYGHTKSSSNQNTRGWVTMYSSTGSSYTGPYGANSNAITLGGFSQTQRHLGIEASGIGSNTYGDSTNRYRGVHLIRTNQIDLTSYSATDEIKLEGRFHMYGSRIGALGFACSTLENNASNEKFNGATWVTAAAFDGAGFTGYTDIDGDGDTGGGLNISYDSNGDETIDVTGKKRIVGQQQTAGHTGTGQTGAVTNANKWRKFEVDLTGAGGQNVYVYMMYEAMNTYSYLWNTTTAAGGTYWRGDCCLDNLTIKYYEPSTDDSDHYDGKIFNIAGSSIQKICNEDFDEGDKVYSTDGSAFAFHRMKINLNGTSSWTSTQTEVVIAHTNANTGSLTQESAYDHSGDNYQAFTFPTQAAFINMIIYFYNVPGGDSTWSVGNSGFCTIQENERDSSSNPQGFEQANELSYNSSGGFWSCLCRIGGSASYRADTTITFTWTDD